MLNVQLTQVFTGHADAVYALANGMSPVHFYSGSGDNFVGCWNLATGTFEKPIAKTNTAIYAITGDVSSQFLYIGQRGGVLYKADLHRISPIKAIEAHKGDIYGIELDSVKNRLFTCGADGYLRVWTMDKLALVHAFHLCNSNVRCAVLSPDGDHLAVGCSDGSLRIFDTKNFEQRYVFTAHEPSVFTVCWLNETQIVSGGRDALMKCWKLEKNKWTLEKVIPAHLYTINHLLLSPDNRWIASASRDKTIKIWDAKSLELLKVLDLYKFEAAHVNSVNRLLWTSNLQLFSAGDDKKILGWEVIE